MERSKKQLLKVEQEKDHLTTKQMISRKNWKN